MPEKRKVLIIEDDPKNLKLAKDLLELGGFEVVAASDAEKGISLAKSQPPDVIVMDFKLPGLNGFQAQKILADDEKTRNIPLVFVTATVTSEEKKILFDTGCAVIAKPINTRTFVNEVRRLIK